MSLAKKINLHVGENIVEVVRPYTLASAWLHVIGLAFLFASAFFMFWLISQGWWGYIVLGLGFALGIFIIFRTWFFNRSNYLVITSDRVIDVTRLSWFEEIISAVGYLDIKDAFIHKRGIFANIFNYGTISIETRNQQVVLELEKVHYPGKVQSLVMSQAEKYRLQRRLVNKDSIFNNFIKIIPDLSEPELIEVQDLITEQLEQAGADEEDEIVV